MLTKLYTISLVRESDAPYLLDLQLFLGKKMILGKAEGTVNYAEDVIVGGLAREKLETSCEWVSKLLDENIDLSALRSVATKGEIQYLKTRNAASIESARRSKTITQSKGWATVHPLFSRNVDNCESERANMLARVSGFRPQETVFEIGKRGNGGAAAEIMKKRRMTVNEQRKKQETRQGSEKEEALEVGEDDLTLPEETRRMSSDGSASQDNENSVNSASDDELEVTFSQSASQSRNKSNDYKDSNFFMSYTPSLTNLAEER